TGLAPPSRSSRAWEASRCASLGTASPMSFATNLHHQAVKYVQCWFWISTSAWHRQKLKSSLLQTGSKPLHEKAKLSTESDNAARGFPLNGDPTRRRCQREGAPKCLEHSPSDRWASGSFFAAKFLEIIF